MENAKPKITFGADPEFFAINKSGTLVPSWLLGIEGTKGAPTPVPNLPDEWKVGVLKDGVAVELNLAPQSTLRSVKNILLKSVAALDATSTFKATSAKLAVGTDTIAVQKKYHKNPLYLEMGCVADLDAFNENDPVRAPINLEDLGDQRFAGGHIHIGCDPWPDYIPKNIFVQFLSGIYTSLVLEDSPRSTREKFYGKPGIWRETPYGVEFRSPNTNWMKFGDNYINFLDQRVNKILLTKNDKVIKSLVGIYNHGLIDEFITAFNGNERYKMLEARENFSCSIENALEGKKYKSKPRKMKLEGYTREGVHEPQPIEEGRVMYDPPNIPANMLRANYAVPRQAEPGVNFERNVPLFIRGMGVHRGMPFPVMEIPVIRDFLNRRGEFVDAPVPRNTVLMYIGIHLINGIWAAEFSGPVNGMFVDIYVCDLGVVRSMINGNAENYDLAEPNLQLHGQQANGIAIDELEADFAPPQLADFDPPEEI